MRAYLVHDQKKEQDLMILPEKNLTVPVNRRVMTDFISVRPNFSQWSGSDLKGLAPETFGRIVATRDDAGDVCVIEASLWQERMAMHLGGS